MGSSRHRRAACVLLFTTALILTAVGQASAAGRLGSQRDPRTATAPSVQGHAQTTGGREPKLPDYLCAKETKGNLYYQPFSADSGDYIIWECVYTPIFKYWWKMRRVGNEQLDEEFDSVNKWVKFGVEKVWQGIVQSAIGRVDLDGNPSNDNVDSIASFDLRGPSGSPIYRTMDVRLLVAVSKGGGPWSACSDTGWQRAPSGSFFWEVKLQYDGPKCKTARYSAWAAGRFLSVSTGQWVTTDWVKTDPISVVVPPPNGPTEHNGSGGSR
jgi:hypothetical protein